MLLPTFIIVFLLYPRFTHSYIHICKNIYVTHPSYIFPPNAFKVVENYFMVPKQQAFPVKLSGDEIYYVK